uniref:RNA binding motif protein 7 n=1 Tax=Sphenodon punctatus TaxID=8508 RepID=A0A8D0GL50_SPHPU
MAGPVINVKIPKDRDGKPKQFAFVNFKHEESVPYGMSLLNGIKLFGRPIKIQFRSGSSHASQDGNSPYSQQGSANTSPTSLPHSTSNSNRYEWSADGFASGQRGISSPDTSLSLQRQAVLNSTMWQQSQYSGKYGSPHSDQSSSSSSGHQQHSHSFNQSASPQTQRRPEASSAPRKNRLSSYPYQADSRHYNREQRFGDYGSEHHYRGNREEYSYEERNHDPGSDAHPYRGSREEYREEYCYEDRNHNGWSHDYDNRRESIRDGKWRPSRH